MKNKTQFKARVKKAHGEKSKVLFTRTITRDYNKNFELPNGVERHKVTVEGPIESWIEVLQTNSFARGYEGGGPSWFNYDDGEGVYDFSPDGNVCTVTIAYEQPQGIYKETMQLRYEFK